MLRFISSRGQALTIAFLLGVSLMVQLANMREEMPWGDDYAMYVMHARNLAEGRAYGDTGFILNPGQTVGPAAYPPGFPLLLAPVYAARGFDTHAFKVEQVVLLMLALAVLAAVLLAELPPRLALVGLAALAANPLLARLNNSLTSDVAFLLFSSLTLLVARRLQLSRELGIRAPGARAYGPWLWATLLGAVVYATVACRSIGAVWLLVLPVCDLLRVRRVRDTTLFALAVAGLLLILQLGLLSAGETSYFNHFKRDFSYILPNTREYIASMMQFWPSGLKLLDRALLVGLAALACWGFLLRVRSGPGLLEVYTAGYLATVLVWPEVQAPRFLVPMLPCFAIYAALAVEAATRRFGKRARLVAVGVPVLVLVAYGSAYAHMRHDHADAAQRATTSELLAFVEQKTPPQAVVIFEKPRTIALYARRRSSAYHDARSDAELWAYFEKVGATHLVVSRGVPPGTKGDDDVAHSLYIQGFAERQAARLEQVFENSAFRVFAIRAPG